MPVEALVNPRMDIRRVEGKDDLVWRLASSDGEVDSVEEVRVGQFLSLVQHPCFYTM